jgi:hypothetical protein
LLIDDALLHNDLIQHEHRPVLDVFCDQVRGGARLVIKVGPGNLAVDLVQEAPLEDDVSGELEDLAKSQLDFLQLLPLHLSVTTEQDRAA